MKGDSKVLLNALVVYEYRVTSRVVDSQEVMQILPPEPHCGALTAAFSSQLFSR